MESGFSLIGLAATEAVEHRPGTAADDVAQATEVGRGLTIKEALDLARIPETASV